MTSTIDPSTAEAPAFRDQMLAERDAECAPMRPCPAWCTDHELDGDAEWHVSDRNYLLPAHPLGDHFMIYVSTGTLSGTPEIMFTGGADGLLPDEAEQLAAALLKCAKVARS